MDPDFQYRTTPNLAAATAPAYSKDDADEGTLRAVFKDLKAVMDNIDKWHAFDLKKEHSSLSVEQQIVAHRLAYEMVEPAFVAIQTALALIDDKYKDRS